MKILDGKRVASEVRREIAAKVRLFEIEAGRKPRLVVINASDDEASSIYVRHKKSACEEVGIECLIVKIEHPCQATLLEAVEGFNLDNAVDGIIVQLPLPDGLDKDDIFDIINPIKDVDVFNPENVGLMLQNRARYLTCTPHGIHVLLKRHGIDVRGKKVTVINSSNIVGKPLFALLLHAGATVTICHHETPSTVIKEICLNSEIIIVAVGIPSFLTKDMVPQDAVVVDVGINRVDGKVVGDVDSGVVAKWISPVPGGVGPMTVTMLLENTLKAARKRFYESE